MENVFSCGALKTHTNAYTVRGRPTLKDIERFWNGSVCELKENCERYTKDTRKNTKRNVILKEIQVTSNEQTYERIQTQSNERTNTNVLVSRKFIDNLFKDERGIADILCETRVDAMLEFFKITFDAIFKKCWICIIYVEDKVFKCVFVSYYHFQQFV